MTMMTMEELKLALPKGLQTYANQEFLDKVNAITSDPDAADVIKENFIGYVKILGDGKFKTEDYLSAVAYVSYKLMGYSNQDAYAKTFPARWLRHATLGTSAKDLSAYVAAYNKNKLVNLILEQSLIPTWVLNQDTYQKAINVQLDLMQNSTSDKVRCEAANSILTHLKPPEVKKVELDIGVKNGGGLDDLRATINALAERQLGLIREGVPAKAIAHERLGGMPVIEDAVFTEVSRVHVEPEPELPGLAAAAELTFGQATTKPAILSGPQPGNPGQPPRAFPSLFGSETAQPGAAASASEPSSTEGGAGDATATPARRPSLFDLATEMEA
jgi:hypothetical protein